MNPDLVVQAYLLAQKRGDTKVTPLHVLHVLATQHADALQADGVTPQAVAEFFGAQNPTRHRPTFAASTRKELPVLTSDEACIAWAKQTFLIISNGATDWLDAEPDAAGTPGTPRALSAVFADLDGLIGLGAVKSAVREIVARQRALAVLRTRAPVAFSKHLVFTGAPGTGKTTVARYVGELYAAINVLPGTAFVEVSRADLIGQYIGHTAPKVQEVVNRARGGVLFIDEAYSLMPTGENDFGHEALSTLVQLMENYRDDLVVIMAGYRDEMRALINVNPGLRSRMTTYIDFPDYQPSELRDIFAKTIAGYGISMTDAAGEFLTTQLAQVFTTGEYGNARYVRSLWEHAFTSMALREFPVDGAATGELRMLTKDDIVYALSKMAAVPAPLRALTSS